MLKVEEVKAKLKEKFSGAREDGLETMATILALAYDTIEAASEAIEKMEEKDVTDVISRNRSAIDKEVGQAIKTHETGLKSKYDFIEKGKQKPSQKEPQGGEPDSTKKAIEEAIAAAIAPLKEQIGAFNAQKMQSERRVVLEKELENIPAAFKSSILEAFNSKTFETDEDFNTYLQSTKDNVASFAKEMAERGLDGFGGKPAGGGKGGETVSTGVAEFIKSQQPDTNKMKGKEI